ncbi:MAG: Nif3-like dinuclear metal center hexameric protein [Bacillota bacterium]|jgi:putative NIF3 family GTP cyclohydrolase 1 type 2
MEVATLIEFLRDLAPQLALPEGVNPAFSRGWAAVKHLGVCIDPTAGVIRNALNRGINILVTYHPWHGEAGQLLSEKDLVIIPLHTAWDNVPEGVNLTFAKELGLADIQFHRDLVSGIANLPLRVILERCRRIVGQNIIPYWGELGFKVKRIGIWAGPGFLPFQKRIWEEFVAQGCDAIISGEISLLPMRFAAAHRLQLIDLGHSIIAKPAMIKLVRLLKDHCGAQLPVEFLGDCYGCNYYTNFNYCQSEELVESEEFISLFTRR